MFEIPEHHEKYERETDKRSVFAIFKRYRNAHDGLIKRAEELRGKDEPRRRDLLKKAAEMNKKHMSTGQIRRAAICGEVDLLIDELRHRK